VVEAQLLRRHTDELPEYGAQQNASPDESLPGRL
jgi:hypothetical protein